jgi:transposase
VKGRKRHLLVDTMGLILQVLVHEANIQDYDGGKDLLKLLTDGFPRLKLIWADSGYEKGGFVAWVKATLGWEVEIVKHPWSGVRAVWASTRCRHRLGADSPKWLSRPQMALDCGTNVRLALDVAQALQGL